MRAAAPGRPSEKHGLNNINLNALGKFNAAASYARDIHDNPTGGDDVLAEAVADFVKTVALWRSRNQ